MEYPIVEGVDHRRLVIQPPLAVGSPRQQVPANVGENKTGSIVVDPPADTFWQHTIHSTQRDEGQLTDEDESEMGLTQVSSRDFRFFQDGQRLQANSTEDTEGEGGCSYEATMPLLQQAKAKSANTKPHAYLSFSRQDSHGDDDEQDSDIDSCVDHTQAIDTQAIDDGIASHGGVIYFCDEDEPFDVQAAAPDDEISSIDLGVVVLPDIEGVTEESSSGSSNKSKRTSSDSETDSTLPTRSPPSSPIRTCKAPKAYNGFLRRRCSRHSSKGSSRHTNQTASSVTNESTIISDSTDESYGGSTRSLDNPPSLPFPRTNKKRISSKTKITVADSNQNSTSSSGISGSLPSSQSQRSHQHTQQTNSSSSGGKPPHCQEETKNHHQVSLTKKMPRRNESSGFESSGVLSLAEDSLAPSIISRWKWHCESLWSPILCLVCDLWDFEEPDTKAADDDTLATFDEELSYEDEGNVNVFVAVQATVLGTDFPTTIEVPKNHMPHIWGSNFVGVVQSPRGDTVHSRRFPPGCRVASISAWSATSHHPYISANSSNLLPVPPLDGLHLDGSDVSVIVAAYLPAFQALHHGLRRKPREAYEPTALEGQRVLILAHSEHSSSQRSSSLNQSLVDARVQAAVKMALWAGARDVHVTVSKVGNTKRNIFGNDYRVRLLDTPTEDWIPILSSRMDLVLDYTGPISGFLSGAQSTCSIAEEVLVPNGRYVGCLGEGCSSTVLDCREEAPINKRNKSTWSEGLSMLQGKNGCASPAILPEAKDIKQVIEWTALCMQMERASLFDFHGSWKQDGRLAEQDFSFLLQLLAKRQIRPYIAKVLDVDYFPSVDADQFQRNTRPMSGAVVCEPWSQYKDSDQSSCL